MKLKTLIVSASMLSLLSACATPGSSSYVSKDAMPRDARLYADVLSARYAAYINDADARAQYASRAFAVLHEDEMMGRQAMVAALNVGDLPLARAIATEIQTLIPEDGISRAILGTSALAKGDYQKALRLLEDKGEGPGLGDINALARGWTQVGLGQNDEALKTFESLSGGKYFELVGTLQRAKLLGQMGKSDEAGKAFAEIDEIGLAAVESTLAQARLALKDGKPDDAKTLLQTFITANEGRPSGPVRRMLDDIRSRQTDYNPLTPAQQASRAITEPAFGYYGVGKQYDTAEVFLRLALILDPDNDKATLFLGSVLEDNDREEDALALFKSLGPQSDYAISARLSEASVYFRQKKNDQAVGVLKTAYDARQTDATLASLGRGYLIVEDYDKALPIYNQLVKNLGVEKLKKDPEPRYLRGVVLERLGRWEEAVDDFEFVLEQKPDDAETLNYLGYTWVDKGVKLTRAFEMIRKAVELEPESGAIIDSLGWAHYKLGQYGQARIKLEEAAERSPESATIIDHLGDVYYKLGRRKEARYQWERALELEPTEKETKDIKAKLKGGLSAVKAGS